MRISDWSSDVCSSARDELAAVEGPDEAGGQRGQWLGQGLELVPGQVGHPLRGLLSLTVLGVTRRRRAALGFDLPQPLDLGGPLGAQAVEAVLDADLLADIGTGSGRERVVKYR